jgi:hypothetical protein
MSTSTQSTDRVVSLATALTALVVVVSALGPRTARALDRVRRPLWRLLHPLAVRAEVLYPFSDRRGRPLLRDKTGAEAEHIATVDLGLAELLRVLWATGFRWNPLSTVKFRDVDGRRQFALSVVWRDGVDAAWQQDVHIFPARDGAGFDVLGHWEPSVTRPAAHTGGDEQIAGDPERVVRRALTVR